MSKSGVEYLAAHPGWKSKTAKSRSNKELAKALRSAASAVEHGRRSTARKKLCEVIKGFVWQASDERYRFADANTHTDNLTLGEAMERNSNARLSRSQ